MATNEWDEPTEPNAVERSVRVVSETVRSNAVLVAFFLGQISMFIMFSLAKAII